MGGGEVKDVLRSFLFALSFAVVCLVFMVGSRATETNAVNMAQYATSGIAIGYSKPLTSHSITVGYQSICLHSNSVVIGREVESTAHNQLSMRLKNGSVWRVQIPGEVDTAVFRGHPLAD